MMVTKRQKQNSRKEKWYAVRVQSYTNEQLEERVTATVGGTPQVLSETHSAVRYEFTDVLSASSVNEVYDYYNSEVDVACKILDIKEITHRQAQRILKADHKPWFCTTTGISVKSLKDVIKHTCAVYWYHGQLCKWRYYSFEK